MRTLTTAAQTEANKTAGAFPVHVLEMRWFSGRMFYTAGGCANLPNEIADDHEPRVIEFGTLSGEGVPERVGGFSTLTVTLADPDGDILGKANNEPGLSGVVAYVHLWFAGTDWDDRVTLFAGAVGHGSKWDDKTANWELKLDGIEKQYLGDFGVPLTRVIFPDLDCSSVEGKIIPIVFGDPCRRVPALLVARPGYSKLRRALAQNATYLYVVRDAGEDRFTLDAPITIYVGVPGNMETITGGFYNPADRTEFTIDTRSSFLCQGDTAGVFGNGGRTYLLIDQADVPDPSTPRNGYLIQVLFGTTWRTFTIDNWRATGAQIACLNITGLPAGVPPVGTPWRILARPSVVVNWPAGVDVYEVGPWHYVVNILPSKEIVAVEARGMVDANSGGAQVEQWFSYNSAYYTATLDDRSVNVALGRTVDDPGLTSVAVWQPPGSLGFSDNTVYVTLRGISLADDPTDNGDPPLTNPADILLKIFQSKWLANWIADRVNDASFAQAATDLAEGFGPDSLVIGMEFGIVESKKLLDLVGEIAFQAGCLIYFDQGKVHLSRLATHAMAADSVLTVTAASIEQMSLALEDPGDNERTTELLANFRLWPSAEPKKIYRKTVGNDQSLWFGKQRKEIEFWCYQSAEDVAEMASFWLQTLAQQQRQITVKAFLPALKVQPGDVVRVDYDDGSGRTVLDATPMRVRKLSHQFLGPQSNRMETIEITGVTRLWPVTILAAEYTDGVCDPSSEYDSGEEVPIEPPPDDDFSTTTPSSTSTGSTTTGPGTTGGTTGPGTTGSGTTAPYDTCCLQVHFSIPTTVPDPTRPPVDNLRARWSAAGQCDDPDTTAFALVSVTPTGIVASNIVRVSGGWQVSFGNAVGSPYEYFTSVYRGPVPGTLTLTGSSGSNIYVHPTTITIGRVDCDDPPPPPTTASTTTGSGTTGSGTTGGSTTDGGTTGGSSTTDGGTSTTTAPCTGNCIFIGFSGGSTPIWGLVSSSCNCNCSPPTGALDYEGEMRYGTCGDTPPTTTTPSTTTPSTTTPSTTTASTTTPSTSTTTDGSPSCFGDCIWVWNGSSWEFQTSACHVSCCQNPPAVPGTFDGELGYVMCQ